MNILKFEILNLEAGDKVVKVEGQDIHVSKPSGEYVIYKLKMDENGGVIAFDVFAVTQGSGSFDLITDADLKDLAELWEE
ncbi:hypothetical protein [Serratia proteamaculans]|uniref:hypothetical protein n=1 Tax=Serratia proteamaculans TaxID=28151 RepID=UPI00217B42E7|nr:hypothetical protein [Serratia proteamaculans]CAI1738425.1 Uncharacterised protein [Serratia proteamaculans]